jgi:hypothetical protein
VRISFIHSSLVRLPSSSLSPLDSSHSISALLTPHPSTSLSLFADHHQIGALSLSLSLSIVRHAPLPTCLPPLDMTQLSWRIYTSLPAMSEIENDIWNDLPSPRCNSNNSEPLSLCRTRLLVNSTPCRLSCPTALLRFDETLISDSVKIYKML